MHTLTTLAETYEQTFDALTQDVEVPVLSGPQCQGDLIVVPVKAAKPGEPVPAMGEVLLVGRGGNAHVLAGDAYWTPTAGERQGLGVLVVPEGGVAFLLHREHGGNGIGPGAYLIRRQREQSTEIRIVQD